MSVDRTHSGHQTRYELLEAWLTRIVGSDRAAELTAAVDAAPPQPAAWRPRSDPR